MKSIAEWLMELPNPYRNKALKYHSAYNKIGKADCLENALVLAFKWTSTKEGGQYWRDVHAECSNIVKPKYKLPKEPIIITHKPIIKEIKPTPAVIKKVKPSRPVEIIMFRPFSSRKEQIDNKTN